MDDVIGEVFDFRVPATKLSVERLVGLNAAKARGRVVSLLRERPLPGERVLPLAVLLDHLGVDRMRGTLGALCSDATVPALNRAAPAWLLLRHDLDPGVSPDRLPVLAESLLLGCALAGRLGAFGPILAAMTSSDAVDVDALVERLEPWRLPAVAPGDIVYGEMLRDPKCRRAHARVLSVLERDPRTDALVRAASESGALDRGLAESFLARPGAEPLSAVGHAWFGARCAGCGGRLVRAVVHVDRGLSVLVRLHLSRERASEADVTPLIGDAFTKALVAETDADDEVAEIALGSIAASAFGATGDGEEDRRAVWFLRRLQRSEYDVEAEIARVTVRDLDHVRRITAALGSLDPLGDLEDPLASVVQMFEAGGLSPPLTEDDDHAVWLELFSTLVAKLESAPIRWGEECGMLPWAWSSIADAMDEAEEERGLLPSVRRTVPPDRADRLAWREVLAAVADDPLEEDDLNFVGCVYGAIVDHEDALSRLGVTPRDVEHEIEVPDEIAGRLAEMLGIGDDDALVSALDGEGDEE